ncbi:putative dihydroflavonol-4-reductase-like [Capsicum annuum]|nr:putative dihydroflavonol-4-reductase-like [Capsicum annuum]
MSLSRTEVEHRTTAIAAQESTQLMQLMKDLQQPVGYADSCDGKLNRQELKVAFKDLGIWFCGLRAYQAMHHADKNKDGLIVNDEMDVLVEFAMKLARDILNVPISTIASESAFSQGRQQLGDNRHSLGSNAMNVLVCLRDWIRAKIRNQGMEPEPSDELKLEEIMTSRENTAESSPMHGFAPVDFDYPMQVPVNINMNELEKMMRNL